MEEGNENAMRDYNKKSIDVRNKYAEPILTDLIGNNRKKIIKSLLVPLISVLGSSVGLTPGLQQALLERADLDFQL